MSDILKKKRSISKLPSSLGKDGTESISSTLDTISDGHIDVERYMNDFSSITKILNEVTEKKTRQKLAADKIKETLNRVTVCIQDWNLLPADFKNKVKREDLLNKLVLMIDHENVKIRFRVIRTCLFLFRNLGFISYLVDPPMDQEEEDLLNKTDSSFYKNTDNSFSKIEDGDESDLSNGLARILKELSKLSREATNDAFFSEEGIIPFLIEILHCAPEVKEDLPTKILLHVLVTIKNISGTELVRQKMLEKKNCMAFSNLLDIINEKTRHNKKNLHKYHKMLYQLTACLRNFAVDPACTVSYYGTNIISGLCQAVTENMQEADLIHNCIRILSKLSLNKDCCVKILEDKLCLENMMKILKIHRNGLFLVVRVTFILANIATFLEEIKEFLYFKMNAFPEIFECFEFYLQKDRVPKAQDNEKMMRMSFTRFDKASANENTQDALVKLIRLMANLLTYDKIGMDFITKNVAKFKFLIQHVTALIKSKNAKTDTELLTSSLSFLANIMYYEKSALIQEDFELKRLKTELLFTLSRFVIQNDNDEVLLEALRVLSNLSRYKTLSTQIAKLKLLEAVIVLLNHTNKEIVYYCIGIIMNLMLTEEMKNTDLQQTILTNIVNILFYSTIDDFDLVSCCLKCATNIIDALNRTNVDQETITNLEELIVNYGEQCDALLSKAKDEDLDEIVELRGIINNLLNNIPEEECICSHPNCGRKFKNTQELEQHIVRRHKK